MQCLIKRSNNLSITHNRSITGNCNKVLESGSVTEHDGDAFCKPCYGKLFGPKGYGFAGGSAGLSANVTTNGQGNHR